AATTSPAPPPEAPGLGRPIISFASSFPAAPTTPLLPPRAAAPATPLSPSRAAAPALAFTSVNPASPAHAARPAAPATPARAAAVAAPRQPAPPRPAPRGSVATAPRVDLASFSDRF
ncbi:MAG TPA: hypothetical protein VFS00_19710, partial [Polyangiaceae bacterium]|nr:hypothetical protein [Polyangiaceae bacterium]